MWSVSYWPGGCNNGDVMKRRRHRSLLAAHAHAVERVQAKRADLEVLYGVAHGLIHRRVRDRCHRDCIFEDMLRLLIQLGAFGHIRGALASFTMPSNFLSHHWRSCYRPANRSRTVRSASCPGPIVAAPANDHGLVLTAFGTLDVLAPFVADDVDLQADLFPVVLSASRPSAWRSGCTDAGPAWPTG